MMVENGKPKMDFTNISAADEMEVRDVKWITILRHPYSRSMSHYSHARALNESEDFTLPQFLTTHAVPGTFHFWNFVPNHQTRWHCDLKDCKQPVLGPEHLSQAMSILEQFHVILILEDMKDPNSCTRLQMRHVLNLTKVEVLEELKKTNSSKHVNDRLIRRATNWYKEIVPELGPLSFDREGNGTSSSWDELKLQVMAALGYFNDMDLQLYGYARKLCTERGIAIKHQLQQQHLRNNATLRSHSYAGFMVSDCTDITAFSPFVATSLQLSSLAIIFVWMLMLPSMCRLRINLLQKRRTPSMSVASKQNGNNENFPVKQNQ